MITVQEASTIISKHLFKPNVCEVPLNQSLGRILAESIFADRDFPPFDRVMMDGIAINSLAFDEQKRIFEIEAVQMAGQNQLSLKDNDKCLEVMTGAILPEGANAVIPYEQVVINNGEAHIQIEKVKGFQNIHKKGFDVQEGDQLISSGTFITSAEIGVLATVGKSLVKVYTSVKVAIVSTGDELVPVNEVPLDYQIRQSNSHVLKASLMEMGFESDIFHINDEEEEIFKSLQQIILANDVIILSGGVSKGKKDFIPEVLERLLFKKLFQGVAQRPGKPFWFGYRDDNKTVFALPGNPVSTFLCFYKFVKPWINLSYGLENKNESAILMEEFTFAPPLTYFLQVKVKNEDGMLKAYPITGKGSGDLANLLLADGFLELPNQADSFNKGDSLKLIRYRKD
jgi:molybdopterin molybdotransferase